MSFRSDLERQCHELAAAELGPNAELVRDREGAFIVMIRDAQGFTRDIDRSETFDTCMQRADGPVSRMSELGTIQLTPEEERVWATLSDDRKRQAVEYIAAGGTLAEFVGI